MRSCPGPEFDIRTVIGDAHAARRRRGFAAPLEKLFIVPLAPLGASLGRRFCAAGIHLEPASSMSLMKAECAGTLQEQKISLRHKVAATSLTWVCCSHLLGVGTPKQWMAGAFGLLKALIAYLLRPILPLRPLCAEDERFVSLFHKLLRISERRMKPRVLQQSLMPDRFPVPRISSASFCLLEISFAEGGIR